MIYFVTNNKEYYEKAINPVLFDDITVINETKAKEIYEEHLIKKKILALDIEANGLDMYNSDILLLGIGNKSVQMIFDPTVDINYYIDNIKNQRKNILGANLKYDLKLILSHTGTLLHKVYDTMIAEQRIYMGLGFNPETRMGYSWSLDAILNRRFNISLSKDIRKEFIGKDKEKYRATPNHLYYLRDDLVHLFDLRKEQQKQIHKYKLEYLIYGIEFPLVSILADVESEGFVLDKEKWLKLVEDNKKELFELEKKMDEEFRRVREVKKDKIQDTLPLIVSGKWDNERIHNPENELFNSDGTMNTLDLFGNKTTTNAYFGSKSKEKKKVKLNTNNINYSSSKDLIQIFIGLQEPVISKHENFFVPKLINGKIYVNQIGASFKEDLLEVYIKEKPNSIMKDFLEMYTKYNKLTKAISTYGESFIHKINDKTGRIHTIFKQCVTDTGRLASGGGKKEPDKINIQNIPGDKRYRECFTVDTSKYSVDTDDYSGAELIVMCSHAQDDTLLELSKGDMHSYFATISWRNIFKYRAAKIKKEIEYANNMHPKTYLKKSKKLKSLIKKANEFTVDKKNPPGYRKNFKPMGFGIIYGMYAKKAGKTLNIIKEEGQIVIDTIEGIIPKTINMVKAAADFATNYGYVIINDRTKSRAWFPSLINMLKKKFNYKEHFGLISKDQSAARNKRIQGTQADFMKESTRDLYYFYKKNNFDAKMLAFIHDEIVGKTARYLDGRSEEWKQYIKDNPSFNIIFNGKSYNNLPEVKRSIMINTANKYLKNVSIKVDGEVKDYWTK